MSDLQCAICLGTFSDPRFLNCGHSFCRDCISGLRKQPSAKSVRCPECRMLTKVSESIDALPVNWVVRRLVDSVKQGSTVYTQGKVPKCAKHSDPAILFCKSCLSLLCVECVKDHAIHINDTCSVDASVAVYHQFLGKTAQGVSKLMADYKADMDEWSAVDSQISLCFQEQKRLLLSNLDKAIAELQEKKTEIEKEVSDDQFRARKLATPQVVPFWRSLRAIEYEVSCLKLKSAKYTAGDLDWTALAKLMELSKMKRDEAPKKGLEPLNISFLNCDKARLKLLRQLIASQSGTPVTFSFPSLPFTLPHVTRKTFTCIGRESLGEPTLFEGPELGPILWHVDAYLAGTEDHEDEISLYLGVESIESPEGVTAHIQAEVVFEVHNSKGVSVNKRNLRHTLKAGGSTVGFSGFVNIEDVYCTGESEGEISYLPTIEVSVTILGYWLQASPASDTCPDT